MISFLRIAISVLGIHLFETTLFFKTGPILSRIDLLILYVAFICVSAGPARGASIGAGVGLFRDYAWSGAPGWEFPAFLAAGWFAGWAHRKLIGESTLGLFLIIFGMVVVHDAIGFIGLIADGFSPFFFRFLLRTVPAGVLTGLLGAAIMHTRSRFRFRVEAET